MVTVYTKQHCRPCRQTKKMLQDAGIEFNEVSLEESPEALESFIKKGYTSAPVVESDSGLAWCGFNIEQIQKLKEEKAA